MPNYLLKGGTIIWPLLLNSLVARACFSLMEIYGPAIDAFPEGQIEADLEALMCVIVNLVHENSLSGPGLSILKRPEKEEEVLNDHLRLFPAPRERSLTMDGARKIVFG